MSGKSKRGKHLPRRKRKGRKTFTAPAASKPVAAQATEAAPEPVKAAPAGKPKAPVTAAQFSNVGAELRRTGIVAGIMIVILIILVLVLA